MDAIFGIFSLGCGLYALYSYYLLKFKKEINGSMLLPKGVDVRNCKDIKGYCVDAQKPLLPLGIVVTLCGAVDLFNTYFGGVDVLFFFMMGAVLVVVVFYSIRIKKINQKYFD